MVCYDIAHIAVYENSHDKIFSWKAVFYHHDNTNLLNPTP